MTNPQSASMGTSRYRSRQPEGQKPPGGGYGTKEPPTGGGYGTEEPPTGGGYGAEEPPTGGYEPEEPPTGGYGPEETPNGGYGPEETPNGGYGEGEPLPCPPSMTCDTSAIDDLQCEAAGVAAEAKALADVAEALAKRRSAFDTARKAYTDARNEAAKTVKEIQRKLNDTTEQIVCSMDEEERDCIDRAFEEVRRCLDECGTPPGCCVEEECDFEVDDWTVEQMAELLRRVELVEACFDDVLVKEPETLAARVAELKSVVDALRADVAADPPLEDKLLYARALAAQRSLDTIWGGFEDVNAFQDCLCRGLTCSLQGRRTLATLAGEQAMHACQDAADKRRCEWLAKNIIEETLATHLRLCPPAQPYVEEEPAQESA